MPYSLLKVPVILNFWILGLVYVINLAKRIELIDQDILQGLDKLCISIVFLSLFVLIRELVFFEQLLFENENKNTYSGVNDLNLFNSENDSQDQ